MGLEELDGCRGGRGTKLLTPWVGTYKPTLVLISRRGGPVTLRGHCPWAGTAVFFLSFLPHSNLLQYLPAESKRKPTQQRHQEEGIWRLLVPTIQKNRGKHQENHQQNFVLHFLSHSDAELWLFDWQLVNEVPLFCPIFLGGSYSCGHYML